MRSYEPLHPGDPFPADAGRVRRYGEKVRRTGELIEAQVALLRRVADGDRWRTDTADAFRDKATELAETVERTRDRYLDVGSELVAFSERLEALESDARALVEEAREEQATLRANPEVTPDLGPDGTAVLTDAQRAQNRRRVAAQSRLEQLQRRFDGVVGAARDAADASAGRIRGYVDDDVKDNWWLRNTGWLSGLRTALGVIALIAAVVLLTAVTGGTVWLIALAVAVAVSAVSLTISVINLVNGVGRWADVVFDTVGLFTVGVGGAALRFLAAGVPKLARMSATLAGERAHSAALGNTLRLKELRFQANTRFNTPAQRAEARRMLDGTGESASVAASRAYFSALADKGVTRHQRFLHGGRRSAELIVGARRLAAEVASDAGAHPLLPEAIRLVRTGQVATGSVNLGSANTVTKNVWEWRTEGRPSVTSGLGIAVDVLGRAR